MTPNEPSNGDIDVPENFSAEEPQQSAEPLESPASSASAETPRGRLRHRPGQLPSRAARTRSTSTSTLAAPPASRAREDDFELDFGSLATTEEPEAAEAEPEEESDAGSGRPRGVPVRTAG